MGHLMTETFAKKEFLLENSLITLFILKAGLDCVYLKNISPCKQDLVLLQCQCLPYLIHLLLGTVKKEQMGQWRRPSVP
ncbi:hypothetical protein MC885_002179 [Smutsia gigantea]|nr:hypothetical protein MC885_002179 [Smutsia gigantea]